MNDDVAERIVRFNGTHAVQKPGWSIYINYSQLRCLSLGIDFAVPSSHHRIASAFLTCATPNPLRSQQDQATSFPTMTGQRELGTVQAEGEVAHWKAEYKRLCTDACALRSQYEALQAAAEAHELGNTSEKDALPGLLTFSQIQERYDTLNKSFAEWEAKMKAVENNLVTAKIPLQELKGVDSTYGKTSSTVPGPPAGDDFASEKNSQVASEDRSDNLAFSLATALKRLGQHLWERITGTEMTTSKDGSTVSAS